MKMLVLGDSLEALIDHRGKTPRKLGSDFTDSGVPVASAILVKNGRLDLNEARHVDDALFRRWMSIPTKAGDVLLTSEAPLGRVAQVRTNDPLVLGQRLFGLRGRTGILDSNYLYFALQTEHVQTELLGRSTGTTVFGIRQSALRKVTIPAPPYPEQQAIAKVLGEIDKKIASNDRVISSIERLMVAIAGSASTRTTVETLAKQSTVTRPPELFDTVVSHFSLPAFDTGATPDSCRREEIKSNKLLLTQPVVLVSKLNPRIPRIWNLNTVPDTMAVASTEFVALVPIDGMTSELWAAMSQPDVVRELANKVAGTSGSHQRVKPSDVLALTVPDPRRLTRKMQVEISALGEAAHSRRTEQRLLSATRDELLPQLMSGRIRVRDAEQQVEDAP